jgi:hypothetical protein
MVPITIGEIETAVILGALPVLVASYPIIHLSMIYLDTGSSDLWVVSDACNSTVCENTNMPPYPSADIKPAGGSVTLLYGDSSTGTHASGPVAQDVAAIAGLSMSQQPFAAISDTNSTAVMHGSNGIFGLGFPSGRCVLPLCVFFVQVLRYNLSQVQATVIDARVHIC